MNFPISQFSPEAADTVAKLGTQPVPSGPYYRADYFELEREAVFRRPWLQPHGDKKGLESGSFKRIHFQASEVMLQHLFHEVDKRVQAFCAEGAHR